MMIKKIYILFTLVLGISTFCFGQQIDSLTFSTDKGLLFLEGQLNGVKTNFAFDTGASMGVLNSKNVSDANIKVKGSMKIGDSQKTLAKIGKAKIDRIQIGSQVFFNTTSVVTDMPFLYCNEAYLLGGDIINQLNWKFDFQKNTVYFSKTPFPTNDKMIQMPFKIKGNRHFASLVVNEVTIPNLLIDFGYGGNCTMDSDSALTQLVVKNQQTEIYKSKNFSMGLNSNSVGKETQSFFADSVNFGSLYFNNFKITAMPKTHNKIGLLFFKTNFKQVIINNTNFSYSLLPTQVTPQKELNFDASFYYSDNGKIEVVALNGDTTSSAKTLTIGDAVTKINNRSAKSFKDRCEFTLWYATQIKLNELLVEQLNGDVITIKKSIF